MGSHSARSRESLKTPLQNVAGCDDTSTSSKPGTLMVPDTSTQCIRGGQGVGCSRSTHIHTSLYPYLPYLPSLRPSVLLLTLNSDLIRLIFIRPLLLCLELYTWILYQGFSFCLGVSFFPLWGNVCVYVDGCLETAKEEWGRSLQKRLSHLS